MMKPKGGDKKVKRKNTASNVPKAPNSKNKSTVKSNKSKPSKGKKKPTTSGGYLSVVAPKKKTVKPQNAPKTPTKYSKGKQWIIMSDGSSRPNPNFKGKITEVKPYSGWHGSRKK